MTGGAGSDIFALDVEENQNLAVDTITDFTPGEDKVVFGSLPFADAFDVSFTQESSNVIVSDANTGSQLAILENISLESITVGELASPPSGTVVTIDEAAFLAGTIPDPLVTVSSAEQIFVELS